MKLAVTAVLGFAAGLVAGTLLHPTPEPIAVRQTEPLPPTEKLARLSLQANTDILARQTEKYGGDTTAWPLPQQLLRVQLLIDNERIGAAYP